MLTKTLEFIEKLQGEEKQMQEEMDILSNEISALDYSISQCHGQLPATGVPMVSQHKEHMKNMLQSYTVEQTSKNWKFYVYSKLTTPLFDSFYNMVSTASVDDLYRSTDSWLAQYCSLSSLRPALLGSLRDICTETSILTDPGKFADQAREAMAQPPELTSLVSTPQTTATSPSVRTNSPASQISLTEQSQYSQTMTDMGPANSYRLSSSQQSPSGYSPRNSSSRSPTDMGPPTYYKPAANRQAIARQGHRTSVQSRLQRPPT